MDVCFDTGDTPDTNLGIDTWDTGISLVMSYNIISKDSCYQVINIKLLGAI